jgi:hypothetical protein
MRTQCFHLSKAHHEGQLLLTCVLHIDCQSSGPNNYSSLTGILHGPGYTPLEAFLESNSDQIVDAAVLEITFQCLNEGFVNQLEFSYVFGSDEYPEVRFA